MKLRSVFALMLLAGCAAPRPTVPLPAREIGYSHEPYRGKPAYLAQARPLAAVDHAPPVDECRQRSKRCDERLRATLAAIDGQLLALSTPARDVELEALNLTLQQLSSLMAPYPDLTSEQRELADAVAKLPTQAPVEQELAHKRLLELSDLLRVQLAAQQ